MHFIEQAIENFKKRLHVSNSVNKQHQYNVSFSNDLILPKRKIGFDFINAKKNHHANPCPSIVLQKIRQLLRFVPLYWSCSLNPLRSIVRT